MTPPLAEILKRRLWQPLVVGLWDRTQNQPWIWSLHLAILWLHFEFYHREKEKIPSVKYARILVTSLPTAAYWMLSIKSWAYNLVRHDSKTEKIDSRRPLSCLRETQKQYLKYFKTIFTQHLQKEYVWLIVNDDEVLVCPKCDNF